MFRDTESKGALAPSPSAYSQTKLFHPQSSRSAVMTKGATAGGERML